MKPRFVHFRLQSWYRGCLFRKVAHAVFSTKGAFLPDAAERWHKYTRTIIAKIILLNSRFKYFNL